MAMHDEVIDPFGLTQEEKINILKGIVEGNIGPKDDEPKSKFDPAQFDKSMEAYEEFKKEEAALQKELDDKGKLSLRQRGQRLVSMWSKGLICRNAWTGKDARGREMGCLLSALSPEVMSSGSPSACPSGLMPSWFAELVPAIDDNGTDEAWPKTVGKFVDIASRWEVLGDEGWKEAGDKVRDMTLELAKGHVDNGYRSDAFSYVKDGYEDHNAIPGACGELIQAKRVEFHKKGDTGESYRARSNDFVHNKVLDTIESVISSKEKALLEAEASKEA